MPGPMPGVRDRGAGVARAIRDHLREVGAGYLGLRLLAPLVAAAWLVGSAARGGLREAVRAVVYELRHRELWSSVQPDAREQWRGPYFDALAALQRQPLTAHDAIAVVLPGSERPDFHSVPAALYEAIYRLYPLKLDCYLARPAGGYRAFWFRSPGQTPPKTPPLLQHEYVIWADHPPARLDGYRALYANQAAAVYRRIR